MVWQAQDKCEALTDENLPTFGKKAPDVLIELGTVASLLDRVASCWWGCSKGDHAAEYLVGRATTLLNGAVRLMRFGLYDEALNLVRSLGESANLMLLFAQDSETVFADWKGAGPARRRDRFKPALVRRRLKKLGAVIPMDDAHYAKLCESATHPTPGVRPQDYNSQGRAILTPILQPAGVIVVLNEAGWLTLPSVWNKKPDVGK